MAERYAIPRQTTYPPIAITSTAKPEESNCLCPARARRPLAGEGAGDAAEHEHADQRPVDKFVGLATASFVVPLGGGFWQ